MKRIGMLTSGGDCQALNAAMRGVVKCLVNSKENVEIYGFIDGYKGLIYGNFRMLDGHDFFFFTDALKQADFFIRTVKLTSGDLPPVLDVEVTGRKEKKELQQGIKRWLDRVESHYGVKPILYTSYKFKTRYLDDSIFNAYPYWIAHYYVDSVKYQGKWDFWQHTDVGSVPGIKEDVDLNVFNGSLEELKKLTIR